MFIQLKISKLSKGYSPSDWWSRFDDELKSFPDLQTAREWIAETYGNRKRRKMYVDAPDQPKHVGYVIGFRNADWSHSPVAHWLEQHWIEFREVEAISPI